MKKSICVGVFLLAASLSLAEDVVVNRSLVGGGGGVCTLGDSKTLGVIVGQGVAALPLNLGNEKVQAGFWIELAALGVSAIQPGNTLRHHAGIEVNFLGALAQVHFNVSVETPATISLRRGNGQLVGSLWQGRVAAGASDIQVPLQDASHEALLLVIEAGSQSKTYQFIPQ